MKLASIYMQISINYNMGKRPKKGAIITYWRMKRKGLPTNPLLRSTANANPRRPLLNKN
jgi:hypothetical protein